MREIELTQGFVAQVDDEDYEKINSLTSWNIKKDKSCRTRINYYARGRIYFSSGENLEVWMHRVIMGLQRGDCRQIDHIDGDGLNNCKSNLRVCTGSQNLRNRKKSFVQGSTSTYKGVSWTTKYGRWVAQIKTKEFGKQHIGLYDSEIEAAKAYDAKALELFGEFAKLNFPLEEITT